MMDEKKNIALNDEQLEKISGGYDDYNFCEGESHQIA